ncbi:MAG: hypothetical protein RSG77_15865 [Hafnia sp.]|uniref:hypothetical protein n=1 Tax=Hafnia sp. TaxID=1873498 RepID=UPI002FC94D19
MSPLILDGHEKTLIWPDDLHDNSQAYQRLDNIVDDLENEHIVILEDDGYMARLYLRYVRSNEISANFVLEFSLTAPEDFPERIPQVISAFVGDEYRAAKLSQHVYRMIMKHYGVVISDTHQTSGGMLIWLRMGEDNAVQLNIMQVRGDRLEYRMVDGKPEAYTGDIEALEQAGDTIWGDPDEVISQRTLEHIGFVPAHHDIRHIALAARPL